jgi:hypothetical protein
MQLRIFVEPQEGAGYDQRLAMALAATAQRCPSRCNARIRPSPGWTSTARLAPHAPIFS